MADDPLSEILHLKLRAALAGESAMSKPRELMLNARVGAGGKSRGANLLGPMCLFYLGMFFAIGAAAMAGKEGLVGFLGIVLVITSALWVHFLDADGYER